MPVTHYPGFVILACTARKVKCIYMVKTELGPKNWTTS